VPAPGATVEVTDGADTWAVKAAHASDSGGAGSYSVSGLPPGAYTVSATLEGTERAVELVTIDPGVAPPPVPLNLGAQASILVEVKEGKGAPKPPVYVRLFPLETFPVTSVAEGETDRVTGTVAFTGLDAPRDYVVAVYRTSTGDEPLNSKSVLTVPGEPVKLPIRIKR
jgi:hypothetical protein